MKNDKEIEQILLNDEKYEKFLKARTEKEFEKILETNTENLPKTEVKDIKKVPKEKLFTKDAVYILISKASKTKSYINGIQAESYLVNNSDREKFLKGETDSFVYGDYYIKFDKITV